MSCRIGLLLGSGLLSLSTCASPPYISTQHSSTQHRAIIAHSDDTVDREVERVVEVTLDAERLHPSKYAEIQMGVPTSGNGGAQWFRRRALTLSCAQCAEKATATLMAGFISALTKDPVDARTPSALDLGPSSICVDHRGPSHVLGDPWWDDATYCAIAQAEKEGVYLRIYVFVSITKNPNDQYREPSNDELYKYVDKLYPVYQQAVLNTCTETHNQLEPDTDTLLFSCAVRHL